MEKTNFRYMQPQDIGDRLEFASVDVSFISLTKILLPARRLLAPAGEMVCLIKPQFEAGREKVGKKGVVRDKKVHEEVIIKIWETALLCCFRVLELDYSPIKGPEGNIEYLIHLKKDDSMNALAEELTEHDVEQQLHVLLESKEYSMSLEQLKAVAHLVDVAHGSLEGDAKAK